MAGSVLVILDLIGNPGVAVLTKVGAVDSCLRGNDRRCGNDKGAGMTGGAGMIRVRE